MVKRCQAAEAKFPGVTVHELRHTAASLMIASGANVKTVQSQLAHKTATMTLDQHGHLFPDDLADIADQMDLLVVESAGKCAQKGKKPGRTTALNCCFREYPVVELPGIEPALENTLNWGTLNPMSCRYVRRRENTCGTAGVVDGVNSQPPTSGTSSPQLTRAGEAWVARMVRR